MPEQPYNLPKYQHRRNKLYNWAIRLWLPVSIHRWNKVFIDRKTAIENRCLNDISINTTTEFRPQNFSYFFTNQTISQPLDSWSLQLYHRWKKIAFAAGNWVSNKCKQFKLLYIYIYILRSWSKKGHAARVLEAVERQRDTATLQSLVLARRCRWASKHQSNSPLIIQLFKRKHEFTYTKFQLGILTNTRWVHWLQLH
jgi:hypothetical protein